ncbi:MAG: glutamate formimidoyltransferase [Bacteroidetes bacterium]|nr:MAG: glutamate formimidoyltransferase [Bacteroidota bacterium]
MKQLIECVPNFSEGRDMNIIKQITDVIETVEGVKLLDVDPGKATNRTVVTFVGTPDEVIDAAFLAIKKASEVIDMSKHHGEHPRFGATDVCPLVPISGITMEETVKYAHKLAERVGNELGIPIYCYEFAAKEEKRRNLAYCRAGEYEGLKEKLSDPKMKPDYGPAEFNDFVKKSGATAISARNFLVAYNVNLNTTSTRRANAIAFDVRENGRAKKENGKILKDQKGNTVRIPGTLTKVKAIGWYIEEYGIAQISMNLTDITVTSVHKAYEEVKKSAEKRGVRVSGSELVGLIPLNAMLDAGKFYLKMQQRSVGISDAEIIKIAVKSLGLDELNPFVPEERIIEYVMEDKNSKPLINMTLKDFADLTGSEFPAPGGGSIAAYMGALGAALGTMVANLSSHKRGWDDRWEEYSDWAEKGASYYKALVNMVDEDTNAFNKIMEAFRLPKKSNDEKAARHNAIQEATKNAINVPFKIMELAFGSMEVMKAMAEIGLQASISDAGVGALAAKAAVYGAFMNVKINMADLEDKTFAAEKLKKGTEILKKATALEKEIVAMVEEKIS